MEEKFMKIYYEIIEIISKIQRILYIIKENKKKIMVNKKKF